MYGNSTYVMMLGNAGAGSQDIFARTSTDGITWTTRSTTHNLAGPLDGLYSSTDGLFVVVGGDNSPNITTSTDGITWQTRTSAFPGNTRAQAIAYYGGTYAAGGGTTGNANGVICTSTNGITWTTRTSNFGSAGIWAMAAGNGVFVAGGTAGTLRTSIDSGVTWVTRTSNFGTTHIYDIGYGDGVFIAGGGAGQLRRSTDGITWTTVSSPFTTSEIVNRVRYVDNVWIAGSNSLYISTDGNTWSLKAPSTFGTSNITAVGSGNGLFIVGVANTAFTSNNYSINNNLLTTFTKVTASE
jgi:hypothetical protein